MAKRNPILERLCNHIVAEKELSRIEILRERVSEAPSGVRFHFQDGSTDDLQLDCDRSTFRDWWKRVGVLWHRYWDRLEDTKAD